MSDDNVTKFEPRKTIEVMAVHLPSPAPLPPGPFTVTISDTNGKMWDFPFSSAAGDMADDAYLMGTAGDGMIELAVNLLTGALRAVAGRSVR